jgi:hypothetical protein
MGVSGHFRAPTGERSYCLLNGIFSEIQRTSGQFQEETNILYLPATKSSLILLRLRKGVFEISHNESECKEINTYSVCARTDV